VSSFHQWEEFKEITKIFHIKIHGKKTNIDTLFESGLQNNIIATDLVINIVLEVHNDYNPYPLGWVNKHAKIKVTKKWNIKFVVSVDFIDELELDILPLDVLGVVFGIPYIYMMDLIFM
jgi:hypothetical protein